MPGSALIGIGPKARYSGMTFSSSHSALISRKSAIAFEERRALFWEAC
jgi:hypothetical protein